MPIKPSIKERIRRFIYGSAPSPSSLDPDMNSMCSKCRIMSLYLEDLERRHKIEAKPTQGLIQMPVTETLNRRRRR